MVLKRKIKITADVLMTAVLLLLMGYTVTGQKVHEWLGTGMAVLFLIHNFLNFKWYKGLFKGKYTSIRLYQTAVNLLLLLAMAGMMMSGILMSRYVFHFLSVKGSMFFARSLHLLCSHWMFVLAAIHLGLHWNMAIGLVRRAVRLQEHSKTRTAILRVAAAGISAYGLLAFIKNDIVSYMLMSKTFLFFDFNRPVYFFFLEYICMLAMWVFLSCHFARILNHGRKQDIR